VVTAGKQGHLVRKRLQVPHLVEKPRIQECCAVLWAVSQEPAVDLCTFTRNMLFHDLEGTGGSFKTKDFIATIPVMGEEVWLPEKPHHF